MPPPVAVRLGLGGDQVWQRFLASRIAREREFCVYLLDGSFEVGFVTGFDDVCLQLSTNDEQPRAVVIRSAAISRVIETGRRVGDLPAEVRDRVRSYGYALRQHAIRAINGSPGEEEEPKP